MGHTATILVIHVKGQNERKVFIEKQLARTGTCARKEDGPDSDIDLLVEFQPGATLFDHASSKIQILLIR